MESKARQTRPPERAEALGRRATKKDQIISLYLAGISDVEDLAVITHARPSYVASVLQQSKLLRGYFDLYTSSSQGMNVYSKFFARKLGYRDVETAHRSMELLDHFYCQFELAGDRAGQHHVLLLGLTMFDRARWTGKPREAGIFRRWLIERLEEPTHENNRSAKKNVPALA